jgi:lysyl-tRNA synthetase, class I
MHSSTGLAVSATDMLAMTPPEVLRFLMVRSEPKKHIEFDPGLGLLDLVDEYDRWLAHHLGGEATPEMKEPGRVLWLAQPSGAVPESVPLSVPYRHVVTLAQVAPDVDVAAAALRRGGFLAGDLSAPQRAFLASRLAHARAWIDRFAPEDVRFQVQASLPGAAASAAGARHLGVLADALEAAAWDAETLHNAVYAAAEKAGVPGKVLFEAAYLALLGKPRGPRFGHFAALQDRAFVVGRLREAAAAAD